MRRFGDPEILIQHHSNCSVQPPPPTQPTQPTHQPTQIPGASLRDELKLKIETIEKEKKQLWKEISNFKKENSQLKSKLEEQNKTQDLLYQQVLLIYMTHILCKLLLIENWNFQ